MHDAMNQSIQGLTSKQIKQINKLTKSALIRDYFGTEDLKIYESVTHLAAKFVRDHGMHPRDAVEYACGLWLPANYEPNPVPILDSIREAGRKLRERAQRLQVLRAQKNFGQQLDLFKPDQMG